jgi:DNA-binding MarR family transcriptional regulator
VANTVRQTSRGLTAGAGLPSARVRVLMVLRDHPGLGVAELARKLSIHASTASNVLRPLLEEGLVSSRRNPDDRRLVQLRATARGLRALASAPGGVGVLLQQALRRLDAATLARLERDLGRVVDALDAADLAAMEPASPATRKRAA